MSHLQARESGAPCDTLCAGTYAHSPVSRYAAVNDHRTPLRAARLAPLISHYCSPPSPARNLALPACRASGASVCRGQQLRGTKPNAVGLERAARWRPGANGCSQRTHTLQREPQLQDAVPDAATAAREPLFPSHAIFLRPSRGGQQRPRRCRAAEREAERGVPWHPPPSAARAPGSGAHLLTAVGHTGAKASATAATARAMRALRIVVL